MGVGNDIVAELDVVGVVVDPRGLHIFKPTVLAGNITAVATATDAVGFNYEECRTCAGAKAIIRCIVQMITINMPILHGAVGDRTTDVILFEVDMMRLIDTEARVCNAG